MADLPNRFSISHHGPAKGLSYEQWREVICRGFCRLDVAPAGTDHIDCHNEFSILQSVSLATPRGTSARFARTRSLLSDGCDDMVLINASHGAVRVAQGSKTIELTNGQMCLTEMNVVGAADLTSAGSFTTTRFPRRFLLQVSPSAEDKLAKPLGHGQAVSMMFNRYFALCNEVANDLDAAGQQAAAQHLADLVSLLLGANAEGDAFSKQARLSTARLDLVKADIVRNLSRADLAVDVVARANGMSERQVQRLFAHSGTTFSEFVIEQRLSLARRLLLHSGRQRKVSDIAYAAGFSDLSYFNRTFRRRFGVTPTELQAGFGPAAGEP